jgi:ribose 5-phosphate isomerase B
MDTQRDIRTIHIGSDHAGFEMKEELIKFLELKDYEVVDHGAYEENPDDDYPDFILPVALEVSQDEHSVGIVLGGSGQGEAIAANRIPGVRAIVYYGDANMNSNDESDDYVETKDGNIIVLGRQHNDSNVLSLGARFLTLDEAKEAVSLWLETDFSGEERYIKRIEEIKTLEKLMGFGMEHHHEHGPNCNHDHKHE